MITAARLTKVLEHEAQALVELSLKVNHELEYMADMIRSFRDNLVLTTGVGKAGIVAQKVAATLTSLSIRSVFLDPVNALHGDIGLFTGNETILVFSHSGETRELTKLLPKFEDAAIYLITGTPESALSKLSTRTFCYGPILEADDNNLAPTTSCVLMLAIGDSLAIAASECTKEDYRENHPGGQLGAKSITVDSVMREAFFFSDNGQMMVDIARTMAQNHAGLACIMRDGEFAGVTSIADLLRRCEYTPVGQCVTIPSGSDCGEAMKLMRDKKVNQIPVLEGGKVIGILDVQDLVGLKLEV